MLKNHLKTAWRTMVKNKTYATINILGLTIGLCACMLVFTVVIDELSYDKFWSRKDDIYKVYAENSLAGGVSQKHAYTPTQLGRSLMDNFPEMEQYSTLSTSRLRLKIGPDTDGAMVQTMRADTTILSMLDIESVDGQLPHYVAGQENILITESFGNKFFRNESPIGKVIDDVPSWSEEKQSFLITGVIKDFPENTHLRADIVHLEKPSSAPLRKDGYGGGSGTYFMLRPGTDARVFEQKMNYWYQAYIENPDKEHVKYFLQPLTDVYLHSDYDSRLSVKGNQRTVYILSAVGILLVLIACINFVNLSTAHVMKRLKETGVRKILGAKRKQLVGQFLSESLLFFVISTVLSMICYLLTLPITESFIGHGLTKNLLSNWQLLAYTLLTIFAVNLLTGIYPAWVLSGLKPANSLRNKLNQKSSLFTTHSLRKTLVVIQFTIAVIILVAQIIVKEQLTFLEKKDIGYDKENLLYVGLRSWEGKGESFTNELKKLSGVISASIAGWDAEEGHSMMRSTFSHPERPNEKVEVSYIVADFDFVNTLGLHVQRGRSLSEKHGTDIYDDQKTWDMSKEEYEQYKMTRSILVPSATAKLLGIDSLGQPIPNVGFRPVGVIKDFYIQSLHHIATPIFVLATKNPNYAQLFIRIEPNSEKRTIPAITNLWRQFYPNRLLEMEWMSDILHQQYAAEQKQQTLFTLFGTLMLAVSAIGVFGLIVHAAEQRVKEIGIRKVLGASVASIVRLLSRDFVKLVLIGIVIASPIAWWAMSKWLEDFAYKIEIQWWMFGLAGLVAVAVAIFTVATQAFKAAVANPVDSLRDE